MLKCIRLVKSVQNTHTCNTINWIAVPYKSFSADLNARGYLPHGSALAKPSQQGKFVTVMGSKDMRFTWCPLNFLFKFQTNFLHSETHLLRSLYIIWILTNVSSNYQWLQLIASQEWETNRVNFEGIIDNMHFMKFVTMLALMTSKLNVD